MRAHEPPSQPTERWPRGCEKDLVVNRERFAGPIVGLFVLQTPQVPAVPRAAEVGFAFHVEVAIGAGKPDAAATADAEPYQAVTAQRVNVDPQGALNRWPPAASSAAKSAHRLP